MAKAFNPDFPNMPKPVFTTPPVTIAPQNAGAAVTRDIQQTRTVQVAPKTAPKTPAAAPAAPAQQAASSALGSAADAGPFAGKGVMVGDNPDSWQQVISLKQQGTPIDWVAFPPGVPPEVIQQAKAAGIRILVWQPPEGASQTDPKALIQQYGAAGYIGQAESQDQWNTAVQNVKSAGVPSAIITNNWNDGGYGKYPPGTVAMPEWYANDGGGGSVEGLATHKANGAAAVIPLLGIWNDNNNAPQQYAGAGANTPGVAGYIGDDLGTPAGLQAVFGGTVVAPQNTGLPSGNPQYTPTTYAPPGADAAATAAATPGSLDTTGQFAADWYQQFFSSYGLPPDLQAQVTDILKRYATDPSTAVQLAQQALRNSPWFAQTFPGFAEGVRAGLFTDETGYRRYLNDTNQVYNQYLSRHVSGDELKAYLAEGASPNLIGQRLQGNAWVTANGADTQFEQGAYSPQGQFSPDQLKALGQENAGIDTALGQAAQRAVAKAQAIGRSLFAGTTAPPNFQLGPQGLNAPSLQGARSRPDIAA